MALKVHNDLNNGLEEFKPLEADRVKMYVCGITPYDQTHLGHARAYVTFDVVRRYLEYSGYEVQYVQNFTDIDDKIIRKSQEPRTKLQTSSNIQNSNPKEECREVAEEYIASYFDVMDRMNVKRAAEYPRATEHIKEMIDWIKGLVDKGFAYVLDDGVYFEVSKFKDYGKLSKRKLKDMRSGARVEVDAKKKDPLDFALWKKAKEGEPSWESPWGPGRPGWHIECSAMSVKYLGERFDIHGGGLDLEFPHHENEIAQTEALTGKEWVRYWMHNGFVNVNERKMSKSLGNFFAMKDILNKYDPMVVRLFLLMTHYRSPINFSDDQLNEARSAYGRIVKGVEEIDFLLTRVREPEDEVEVGETDDELARFRDEFRRAMDDDFNTAKGVGVIFDLVFFINKHIKENKVDTGSLKEYKKALFELCGVLGLLIEVSGSLSDEKRREIEKLVMEREKARGDKDFAKADAIRKDLLSKGIVIEDTPFGPKWTTSPLHPSPL